MLNSSLAVIDTTIHAWKKRQQYINDAWDSALQKGVDDIQDREVLTKRMVGKSLKLIQVTEEMLLNVFSVFNRNGVKFIRAPFVGGLEMAKLENQGYTQASFGNWELLVYGSDRVISHINFEKGRYGWVDKNLLLNSLEITGDQFVDMCILAGFNHSNTFQALLETRDFSFDKVYQLVKEHGTGAEVIRFFNAKYAIKSSIERYPDALANYERAISVLLSNQQTAVAATANKNPHIASVVHKYANRNSSELVLAPYIENGVLGIEHISSIFHGASMNYPPLYGEDTVAYRVLLHQLSKKLKIVSLELLCGTLMMDHSSSDCEHVGSLEVKFYDYFQQREAGGVSRGVTGSNNNNTNNKDDFVVENIRCQKVNSFDYGKLYKKSCLVDLNEHLSLGGEELTEIQAGLYRKALNAYLNIFGSQLNPKSSKFLIDTLHKKIINENQNDVTTWPYLAVAMSLINDAQLNGEKLRNAGMGSNIRGKKSNRALMAEEADIEQDSIRLLSRIFSIMPLHIKADMDFHPFDQCLELNLSRDLINFNSLARVVTKSHRYLIESILLNIAVAGNENASIEDYTCVYETMLPFSTCQNVGLGLVFISVAENANKTADMDEFLKTCYPNAVDPIKDFSVGVKFWKSILACVCEMNDNGVVPDSYYQSFVDANEFLIDNLL